MSSGFLTPEAALREFSDLGVVIPGAKLHTYVSGTPSTPLATYSDVGLTIPNANPIVASAGGQFGPIYLLPGVAYKFLLADASDVTVPGWPRDPVTTSGINTAGLTNHGVVLGTGGTGLGATATGTAGQVLTSNGAAADPTFQAAPGDNGVDDFRLTLTSGLPVTPADVTAAATIYLSPYKGNRIALYDAAGLATILTSAQVSIAVPAVASQLYDVFAFNNAGVVTLELLAWTNDTTRATAIVLTTTGTYTKTGDLTRRYLGSVRTTAVAGQTEDSALKRYLWNYYHRVPRALLAIEATANWNYSTATVRQANGAAANQVEIVIGVAEVPLDLELHIATSNSGGGCDVSFGIGEDSTTTYATGAGGYFQSFSSTLRAAVRLLKYPAVGRHFYAWNEFSAATPTTTWYSAKAGVGSAVASGLSGAVDG